MSQYEDFSAYEAELSATAGAALLDHAGLLAERAWTVRRIEELRRELERLSQVESVACCDGGFWTAATTGGR